MNATKKDVLSEKTEDSEETLVLDQFMRLSVKGTKADFVFKTAHREITCDDLDSTWQRRCCGEQGEKVETKDGQLRTKTKAIDHSFYIGEFVPQAAMILSDPLEIERRFNQGGLPAAGNSSDHFYVCVEYTLGGDVGKFDRKNYKAALKAYKSTAEVVDKDNANHYGSFNAFLLKNTGSYLDAQKEESMEWYKKIYKKPMEWFSALFGAEKSTISETVAKNNVKVVQNSR